ncbi:MAG: CU044_5270 family protein [Gaiellaceae bacterium]
MTDTLLIPPLRDLPTGHLEARKQHLLAEIVREPKRPRLAKHFPASLPLKRRRWQVAAIALAAAAVVAITFTVLLPGNGGGLSSAGRYIHRLPRTNTSEQGGPRLAAVVLLRAARTAANQPENAPRPGQFVYTKTEGFDATIVPTSLPGIRADWAFQPVTRETWTAPDGSGRLREVEGHLRFATHADAAYFYRTLRNQQDILNGHSSDSTVDPGGNPYVDLSKMPTDPAKLKRLIEHRKLGDPTPPGNADTFLKIENLLSYSYAPPAVRSALYTIASQLPGVQLIGPTHDPLGRPGTAVAYGLPQPQGRASKDLSSELIFDPHTSALLATQWVVVHRTRNIPFPPGTVVESTAYVASGVVNSTSATTPATP